MSGKASSSQPSMGLGGLGALSHVYIQYPPLHCSTMGSTSVHYDDGNKLLISTASNQIFSWKTVPFNPHATPTCDSINEGPVLHIRFSLDTKVIAVQRSSTEIEFYNRETKETFSQRCRSESENIIGFFWTDCPLCDIVIVKTSGLDLFAYNSAVKSLDLVETKKFNVTWYVYTHESRLILVASGLQCRTLTGFQLSSAGIIRLPKFDMAMAKPDGNSKPVLDAADVLIVTVYGRIYCFQVDKVAMLLHSYRFYRDAIVQQGSLPIYSSKIAVSVVDNVLLVHQVDAKVVILYDIFADSRAPISAPLPLLLRGFPRSQSSSRFRDVENSEVSSTGDREAVIYGDNWTYLVPDLIYDISSKCLWKIHLDVEAIATSSSDGPSVLEFLQRRKLETVKAKQLCLEIVRTVILERRPVSVVAKAMDVLVTSYSHSIKTGSYFKGLKNERTSPSTVPSANSPMTSSDVSTNRIDGLGKSSRQESPARIDSRSLDRSSTSPASESDISSFEASIMNRARISGAENANDTQSSSLRHQLPGSSDNSINPNISEQQDSQLTSPAISPDEMYRFVFAPVEEEMVGDPAYLVSIIVEFLRSANSEKIKINPNLYVLIIQLLARNERYAELGLFIINKILEPSKEVAMQLLESGGQTRKLGLDMLRQLCLHHEYVLYLLQDGYYGEALRYARKHKVTSIRASLFLEAAMASNDSQHLAAVLRFFTDFIPDFHNSPDFNSYYRLLSEMNTSIAA